MNRRKFLTGAATAAAMSSAVAAPAIAAKPDPAAALRGLLAQFDAALAPPPPVNMEDVPPETFGTTPEAMEAARKAIAKMRPLFASARRIVYVDDIAPLVDELRRIAV